MQEEVDQLEEKNRHLAYKVEEQGNRVRIQAEELEKQKQAVEKLEGELLH